jgi:ABC-type iron transport system FetAB permease component
MSKKQSLTITGLIVILLGFILEKSGLEIGTDRLQTFVEVLLQLGGFVIAYIGRVRQGDVNILGRKQ